MQFSTDSQGREEALIGLFTATFSTSEGPDEGALIGDLVDKLLRDTPASDRFCCIAEEDGRLLGACVFSRMRFAQDQRRVFILAPVAVASQHQGRGIGQQMLTQGLDLLRNQGIDIVLTYGDPGYYSRVGFQPISTADAIPPLALQQPQGWLGQSLTDQTLTPLRGPSRCVPALNDPRYW
ncbi:MAG: N-acetyltransferase [Gammaproteobacteria bacterium]|nr:N-acetyltransferase [Gammaproteobacteria bacterium]